MQAFKWANQAFAHFFHSRLLSVLVLPVKQTVFHSAVNKCECSTSIRPDIGLEMMSN